MNNSLESSQPENWPIDGLEKVQHCPVCKGSQRKLLYGELTDRLFGAPGQWTMYQCLECESGYLDPRPTKETIGLAYQNYFTHELRRQGNLPLFRTILRNFANGYHNKFFNTHLKPAYPVNTWVKLLLPGIASTLDADMRHLSQSPGRLLDIGSGNGQFLLAAKSAGWSVHGIEPDKKAVLVARNAGLDITQGNLEEIPVKPPLSSFDVITASHVIEHVHEPDTFLIDCFKRLKKGGYLWLETPNINSLGRQRYNHFWRGLEPPRHLTLFSQQSLISLLNSSGFDNIKIMPYRSLCYRVWSCSTQSLGFFEALRLKKTTIQAEKIAQVIPDVREFITVRAYKTHA